MTPVAAAAVVARSEAEVLALRSRWLDIAGGVVATDPDWVVSVARVLPGEARPHAIAFVRGESVEALAVGNARMREVPCRVGRKAVYSPVVSTLTIVEDGFLGRLDDASARALAHELRATLHRGEADVCLLLHVPATSPIRAALRAVVPGRRRREAVFQRRWSRQLPDSYDDFLATLSSGMRKSMRRNRRRLEGDLGARLDLRAFRRPEDVDELLRHAEFVTRRTYQRELGVGFRATDVTRWSIAEGARRQLLRAWVLYVDGEPIAVDWGLVYNGTFRWVDGAFDPAYSARGPGTYLTGKVIEALCEDADVRRLDFGLGDSEYKRRLGCTYTLEGDILVAAARPRPLWMAAVYGAGVALTKAYRAVR